MTDVAPSVELPRLRAWREEQLLAQQEAQQAHQRAETEAELERNRAQRLRQEQQREAEGVFDALDLVSVLQRAEAYLWDVYGAHGASTQLARGGREASSYPARRAPKEQSSDGLSLTISAGWVHGEYKPYVGAETETWMAARYNITAEYVYATGDLSIYGSVRENSSVHSNIGKKIRHPASEWTKEAVELALVEIADGFGAPGNRPER